MTTRYTMTTEVQAWRVADDGSLPQEAEYWVWWHAGARDPDDPIWRWVDSMGGLQAAGPGDWVVRVPDGLVASSNEDFRECCTEVGDDA